MAATQTKPLLDALFKWLATLAIPTTFALSKALKYILSRKRGLTRFLGNALLSPDNNATERVVRGVVVGRKNHYGSRSEQGTKVAALMYSLLDSAEPSGMVQWLGIRDQHPPIRPAGVPGVMSPRTSFPRSLLERS